MPQGKCKLCQKDAKLQRSHLIGRAVYKLIREDEGEDPIVMTPDLVMQTSRQVRDYVLCTKCEDRFSKGGEKYITKLLWRRKGFPLLDKLRLALPIEKESSHIAFSGTQVGVDTEKLAYYALSIVWRCAVHEWKTLGNQKTSIDLLEGLEEIRRYLLGETGVPPSVGVVVTVCTDIYSQTHVLAPTMLRDPTKDILIYPMLIRGLHLQVVIAKQGIGPFSEICCFHSQAKKLFVADQSKVTIEAVRPFHEASKVALNVRSKY